MSTFLNVWKLIERLLRILIMVSCSMCQYTERCRSFEEYAICQQLISGSDTELLNNSLGATLFPFQNVGR